MVASLDGFIAKTDNSVAWFETSSEYDKGIDAESADEFFKKVDCFVMGSATYLHAYELSKVYGWAYGEKPTFVITSKNLQKEKENIEFYNGNLIQLVNEQLKPKFKNVWVAGGPMLAVEFIKLKLANEIRVSILPILLGEGLLYFNKLGKELNLKLKESIAYKNGMVELCYEVMN